MSACFKDREDGGRNLAAISGSNFNSRTERISDVSSCDESPDTSDDNPSYAKSPGSSSWSLGNKKNNKEGYGEVIDKSDGTNDAITKPDGLDTGLKLPPIQEVTINQISEEDPMPKIEDLTLDSDCESLMINKIAELSLNGDHKPLAGVVTSVAKGIGLIVVKPPMPYDVLLYLGSPVFVKKSSTTSVSKDVKLGWIIDVFGPACEPYYCVKPINNGIQLVHEGTQLFYSPDHPRTVFLCLKQEDGNRYTVLYSPRCPLLSDHQKVPDQPGEKDFWSNASKGNSRNRQLYRRRHGGSNRGTYAYRNKYRNDLCAFPPIQPKHSYFDY